MMRFLGSLILITIILPAFRSAKVIKPLASPQTVLPATFTFADIGEKDILVNSIYDRIQVEFPLAEGRRIERGVLKLHLSHGKRLLPGQSDLTVALNDEPAVSIVLTPENAEKNFIDVELPAEVLRPGENILTFRFNLRLRDKGCGDAGKPGLWAKIFSDTAIELSGYDIPIEPDLGRFPAPFTTLSNLPGNPQISIILPPAPTPAELTATGQIAAALGQAGQWESPPLWVFIAGQNKQRTKDDHLILIDTAGRNPLVASHSPGLTEQLSPYNPDRLMLTVSGSDEASLAQATMLLTTQSARPSLEGTQVSTRLVDPITKRERPSLAFFSDLGFTTERLRGIGEHDLYFPLDVPYDWKLTNDASIKLHFSHAYGLASTSHMDAFINGTQVANIQLNNRNDDDGQLLIRLSPRQIRPGRNWLHILFDLHRVGENCNYRYMDEAWAEISTQTSEMNLAHVSSQPPLELRYLPSPLVTPPDLSSNIFVLPEHVTSVELTAMARLAAKLGTYSTVDSFQPQVTTANLFSASTLPPGTHTIAIGIPKTNTLLAQYDKQLPQPLSLVNGVIEPSFGRELLQEEQSNQASYLQVLPAPWSGRASLVVISAPDEKYLLRAIDIIPALSQRLKIQGNVAIITARDTTGLSLGGLTGAPLSEPARVTLSFVLIGAFFAIGSIGVITNRQSKTRKKEGKSAEE